MTSWTRNHWVSLTAWLCFAFALGGSACDIPVFRYALERWPPDSYRLTINAHGALGKEHRAVLELLQKQELANVLVTRQKSNAKRKESSELPWMVLRAPVIAGHDRVIWSGRLTEANVKKMIDSPARQELARRLLSGAGVVWLLLESGNKARDDKAAEVLKKALADLSRALRLSLTDAPPDDPDPDDRKPIAFPIIRLTHADPAETVLVSMLMGTEGDLSDYAGQPMAFPVFGRGQVLWALVGKGINKNNIAEACEFLCGPCSCQVKAENPGADLLMMVDWEKHLEATEESEATLLPLVELTGVLPVPPMAVASSRSRPQVGPDRRAGPPGAAEPSAPTWAALLRNLTVVFAVLALVLILATIALRKRKRIKKPQTVSCYR